MRKFHLFIIFWFCSYIVFSQINYKYWIGFTDKKCNLYSLDYPEQYLSQRAIQRRIKHNIPFNIKDLPVTKAYIDSISLHYPDILYASKWLNGIVIQTNKKIYGVLLNQYDFIKEIREVYSNKKLKSAIHKFENESNSFIVNYNNSLYGQSYDQFLTVNGSYLHTRGYKGENILIAVLDAGFNKADIINGFDSLRLNNRIVAEADFVFDSLNLYNSANHGMHVLSILAGYNPGYLIGTAPNAYYCLIRTEDISSEYPVEEYNWVRGAEFADSIGADIINSSLGYYIFDDSAYNYKYEDLNGNISISTIGADIAASKGILVVSSAGNAGRRNWRYILAPSDGDSVICVGAINKYKQKCGFSSFGPRTDGQIKPNVMALGDGTIIQLPDNSFIPGFGTSYAAPIISGLAACLWQAYPNCSNMQIFNIIEKSSDSYFNPSDSMGYGIPDFIYAYSHLYNSLEENKCCAENVFELFPNPFIQTLNIIVNDININEITIQILSSHGKIIFIKEYIVNSDIPYININKLNFLKPGIYFIKIITENRIKIFKTLKS